MVILYLRILEMGRYYKRKDDARTYQNYTADMLNEALTQIAEGKLPLNKASKQYNIPYGTLHNKFHGKHVQSNGGQTAQSAVEESASIQSLTTCSDWGFTLSLLDLRLFVKSHLDRQSRNVDRFSNNIPGVDWAYSFLKRNKGTIGQRLGACIKKKELIYL